MNNGLSGRYLPQLEAWNKARKFTAELVSAYFDSEQTISHPLYEWQLVEQNVDFPSVSELKQMVSNVMFLDGRNTIDMIARQVMKWDGWRGVTVESQGIEVGSGESVTV